MDWLDAAVTSGSEPRAPEAAEIADTGAELGLEWLSAAATAEVSGDDAAVQDAVSGTGDDMDWLGEAAPETASADVTGDEAVEFDWMADVKNATESEAGAAELTEAGGFDLGDFDSDEV